MSYKNWIIFKLCKKKNNNKLHYIILNFNYPILSYDKYIFLVIFFNKKVRSILNLIHKIFFINFAYNISNYKKEKNTYLTKRSKRIKINLDLIFNYFSVHRTGLRLLLMIAGTFWAKFHTSAWIIVSGKQIGVLLLYQGWDPSLLRIL